MSSLSALITAWVNGSWWFIEKV